MPWQLKEADGRGRIGDGALEKQRIGQDMEYVRFGNTGIRVSRLCLGCMDFPERVDAAESARIVATALDKGINFLDTADVYGKGESEKVLGKVLKGRRNQVILATKFWAQMYPDPNGKGCSRIHILRAVEDSLRRLQTDYLDLYQLHHPAGDAPVEEILSTLDTLVKQGKVRYIGVCNHYAWQVAHMLGVSALHNWEPVVSIQCSYSILDRVIENETVPFAERFNLATMMYSPLCRGALTGKYRRGEKAPEESFGATRTWFMKELTDAAFDILDGLRPIAEKYGIGMNQLAVAWVLSKPYVTSLILGGATAAHSVPLYDTLKLQIDPADLKRIDDISEARRFRAFLNQPIVHGPPIALDRW